MPHVIDYTTLALAHVTAYLAFIVIMFRSILRWHRREKFGVEDYLMLSATVWLAIRLGMIHMVLVWGTNNISDEIRQKGFDEKDIQKREIASKLLLVNRFAYNTL